MVPSYSEFQAILERILATAYRRWRKEEDEEYDDEEEEDEEYDDEEEEDEEYDDEEEEIEESSLAQILIYGFLEPNSFLLLDLREQTYGLTLERTSLPYHLHVAIPRLTQSMFGRMMDFNQSPEEVIDMQALKQQLDDWLIAAYRKKFFLS